MAKKRNTSLHLSTYLPPYVLNDGVGVLYQFGVNLRTRFLDRPLSSSVLPDADEVCNTDTLLLNLIHLA